MHGPMNVKLGCQLHEGSGEGSTKLFSGGPKDSGSERLQIFRNNITQLIRLITPHTEPGRYFVL